jgi:hypothetical protein
MAKPDFGCCRSECKASTNINEDPSFGTGELDDYGFWEYPCYECARAFEKLHPEYKCWPYQAELGSDLEKALEKVDIPTVNFLNAEYDCCPEEEENEDEDEILATMVTIALCDAYVKGGK